MQRVKKMLGLTILLLFSVLFLGCSANMAEKERSLQAHSGAQNMRRGLDTDTCIEDHAGPYIALFLQDYPDMQVTKVRWQNLHTGDQTYVIEGISGQRKCIVKYHMATKKVLGRTERELFEEEKKAGHCIEKPLDLLCVLTQTELCEIATNALGGEMHELKIYFKGDAPLAYAEVRDENLKTQAVVINACTGEIIYQ